MLALALGAVSACASTQLLATTLLPTTLLPTGDLPSNLRGEGPAETIDWLRVLTLRDYNTRIVVLGTTLLGLGAGVVGSFTLLRKRALLGDALSHATLPGIALAFLIANALGSDGKHLPVLLLGAAVSGVVGVGAILAIRRLTKLKEDAALGIVLSVFFGAGVALLGLVQQSASGNAAGLESFIYGKTASLLASDALMIGVAALLCLAVATALSKELRLLCFDATYAAALGYPIGLLDATLMGMVVIITILGLQAVGLVLMIALLVIPAAAARFWTESTNGVTLIAGGLGAASSLMGSLLSAALPRLPSGAMIVLVSTALFVLSATVGTRRGVLRRWGRRRRFERAIHVEHLLRAVYEIAEVAGAGAERLAVPIDRLLRVRSWSSERLRATIAHAQRESLVQRLTQGGVRLTERGSLEAERLTRQHRLWELYLITHADIAPARVDRRADAIEHVLEPETIARLERLLESRTTEAPPASPHALATGTSHGSKTPGAAP
ncbi:metal ABC transporter permease [Botrimarina hoheduenensis]|nr:iron chelate uptake ABC transporter family permease subunit [Botrimarina hoheduenensis]